MQGNPSDYNDLIGDVLQRHGYDVKIAGKTDWSAGGHSLTARLTGWTMYTQFPYNVNKTGGWSDEDCTSPAQVANGTDAKHRGDWVRLLHSLLTCFEPFVDIDSTLP